MPNLSPLETAQLTAAGLSGLILVSPQNVGYQAQNTNDKDGQQKQLAPSFLFDFEGENTAALESDITDHYIEDNTAIQDQIALRPELVTVTGFIGELNNVVPPVLQALKTAAEKLTIVSAYTPELTVAALEAYNTAFQNYQAALSLANASVSAWRSINGDNQSVIDSNGIVIAPNQNRQQVAFQMFYGYWRSRTLFTLQSPWAIHKNMAIKSLKAIQSEETRMMSSFEITFKQMRFANTFTVQPSQGVIYDNNQFQGRLYNQGAPTVDLGTSSPADSTAFLDVLNA